jgi:hypothetical protein
MVNPVTSVGDLSPADEELLLGEDRHARARAPLPDLLRRVDALLLKARRHADVSDHHLGPGCLRARDQTVVVGRRPDEGQVRLQPDEGADSLPDDQVVVGEEHRDPPIHMSFRHR